MAVAQFKRWSFVLAATIFIGCTPATQAPVATDAGDASVRQLTLSERKEDFSTLVTYFKELYGPLKLKEEKLGFNFSKLVSEFRLKIEKSKSEAEFVGLLHQFLARFQDSHVFFEPAPGSFGGAYSIDIGLTQIEGRAIVQWVGEKLATETQMARGDEILAIDQTKPTTLLNEILKYRRGANPITDRWKIALTLSRWFYMTDLKPKEPTAKIKFSKPNGKVREVRIPWTITKNFIGDTGPQSPEPGRKSKVPADLEPETPFWFNDFNANRFKMTLVEPSDAGVRKYSGQNSPIPKLFAARFSFNGKNILLARISTYDVSDDEAKLRLAWYRALLEEFEATTDALVIDQTYNPGGSESYATSMVQLFARPNTRGVVYFVHADRLWLKTIANGVSGSNDKKRADRLRSDYELVSEAIDQGLSWTAKPLALEEEPLIQPLERRFTKPVLILENETSASAAEIFASLMKDNGLATVFGQRTTGAGGTVESVLTLPVSGATLNMTRSIFMTYSQKGIYDLNKAVENNGIQPDVFYDHSVKDFRNGFADYVATFVKTATNLSRSQ